jgi:hypothetical protein
MLTCLTCKAKLATIAEAEKHKCKAGDSHGHPPLPADKARAGDSSGNPQDKARKRDYRH